MKKITTHWNKFTVYGFAFNGPTDLCEYVKKAPINTRIFPINKVAEQGSEGSDLTHLGGGWYRTKNLAEALRMCEDGWYEGYDFYKNLNKIIERNTDKIQVISINKDRPINIFVNLSYCWETPTKAIINRGVIIQNLIRVLENNNYKVNLKAFVLISAEDLTKDVSYWNDETTNRKYSDIIQSWRYSYKDELSFIIINLKEQTKLLDPRKAYFAFCNPSFLRRIVFRVMESSDFKNPDWACCYGYSCNSGMIRRIFNAREQDIVIPQAWDIGIQGDDINKDWKQFLKYEHLEDFFQA